MADDYVECVLFSMNLTWDNRFLLRDRRQFSNDPNALRVLARALWIVSRYWMDHLRELEGLEHVTWADQERGVQHHFAVLLPYLPAAARRI